MRNALEWIINKAPEDFADAPMPIHHVAQTLRVTADDEDEDVPQDEEMFIEELFTVIDYQSASGELSRRRITMRKLAKGPNGPLLRCICHEKKSIRTFRCDRIRGVIDEDGVVTDASIFFREVFGIDLSNFSPSAARTGMALRMRDVLRPALSLLVIAARSDTDFHLRELNEIEEYAENEIEFLLSLGLLNEHPTIADMDALRNIVANLRPARSSAIKYLRTVMDYDEDRFNRFALALKKVVDADGRVVPAEIHLLAELRSEQDRWIKELDRLM